MAMRIAVVRTPKRGDHLRSTFISREWEEYQENAEAISEGLASLGHTAYVLQESPSLASTLQNLRIEVVWVCSAGGQGRDPTCHLPSMLEMLGLPYVGSPPMPSAMADDKSVAKRIVQTVGVKTPEFRLIETDTGSHSLSANFPLVVKPIHGFGGCGVYLVCTPQELDEAVLSLRSRYRTPSLVEAYIEGADVTVPILQVGGRMVGLHPLQRSMKWEADSATQVPGYEREHRLSRVLEGVATEFSTEAPRCIDAAIQVSRALNLRHFARIDFRFCDSEAFFLEANHKPDLRPASLFTQSANLSGWTYKALLSHLLNEALSDYHSALSVPAFDL
ncbi:D-alanine--D-alanine ligase family protein [Streptomyces sp. NPDC002788]